MIRAENKYGKESLGDFQLAQYLCALLIELGTKIQQTSIDLYKL